MLATAKFKSMPAKLLPLLQVLSSTDFQRKLLVQDPKNPLATVEEAPRAMVRLVERRMVLMELWLSSCVRKSVAIGCWWSWKIQKSWTDCAMTLYFCLHGHFLPDGIFPFRSRGHKGCNVQGCTTEILITAGETKFGLTLHNIKLDPIGRLPATC